MRKFIVTLDDEGGRVIDGMLKVDNCMFLGDFAEKLCIEDIIPAEDEQNADRSD